jgi:hypothetical protein
MTVRYYSPLPLYSVLGWPGWHCDRCQGIKVDLPNSDPSVPLHKSWCQDARDPEADGVMTIPHVYEPLKPTACLKCGDICYANWRACFCCRYCYSYSDDAP